MWREGRGELDKAEGSQKEWWKEKRKNLCMDRLNWYWFEKEVLSFLSLYDLVILDRLYKVNLLLLW